jgi:hypothetical protein
LSHWRFAPELLAAYRGTGHELIPLHAVEDKDERGRLVGKAPVGSSWRLTPHLTVDEAQAHMESGGNVGVRMRECDLVVDVDPRNFKEEDDPLRRLEADLGIDLTDYPRVVTGSNGFHIYMTMPPGTLLRDTLEAYQGIEFKALGRQVVAAGSVHPGDLKTGLAPGGQYRWDPDPLAVPLRAIREAPAELIQLAMRPGRIAAVDAGSRTPEELGLMLDGLDPCEYGEHGRWLELMMACHHATAGEGRDEFIEWSTGDPEYASDAWIIGRRWDSLHNDTGGRRITEKTLFKALVDARRADLLPRTSAEEDFADDLVEVQAGGEGDDDLENIQEGDPAFGPLERLNAKGYCAVNENGTFRIYRPKRDYSTVTRDTPEARMFWETYRKGDFLDILSNVRIQKGENGTVPLAVEWLKWGGRTSYDGVSFDPGNRIPKSARVLNLWTDWAVEPKKGDWSLLKKLLLEGLCDGDERAYEYVLDWSAHMVQRPDEQAEVALVFKGQKGTGKGTYGRALYKLAGRHGMHISNQQHFTNHFNAHLRDCILLFADEAIWAGDRKAEGSLKALITEPTIVIEAKGKDVVTARNYLHVVMASNEDWVIPASMDDERRFFVSEVSSKFRGNKAFFDALHGQLNDGGLQAMLFELKTRKLGDFHPRAQVPQTAALAKQKLQSLDNIDAWWYECLCKGNMGDISEAIGNWDSPDPTDWCVFFTEDLQASLEAYLRKLGDRHLARRSSSSVIGDRLKKRLKTRMKHVRMAVPNDRLDIKADSSGRAYAYRISSLAECRIAFENQLGSKLPWELDAEDIDPLLDVEEID